MSSEVIIGELSQTIELKANDLKHTSFNCKAVKSLESLKKSIPRSQVVRIIDGDDELKKTTMSPIIAAIASRLLTIITDCSQTTAPKATSRLETNY